MLKMAWNHRIVFVILIAVPLVMLSLYSLSRRQPAPSPAQQDPVIQVVTSIHPLSAIVREVGGDDVRVITLLPAGGSAHLHEVPPSTLSEVRDADLLMRVGGGLDDWADVAFNVSSEDSIQVRLVSRLREVSSGTEEFEWSDPHIWLDPLLVRDRIVPLVGDLLSDLRPDDSHHFRSNSEQFRSLLTELHGELERIFTDIPERAFIADHAAWSHFADRYGLQQVGVLEETPGHECGPREVAGLINTARAEGIDLVTTTKGHGTMLAEALADQIGATVLELDPIGGGPAGPQSYIDLLWQNAQRLAEALSGRP